MPAAFVKLSLSKKVWCAASSLLEGRGPNYYTGDNIDCTRRTSWVVRVYEDRRGSSERIGSCFRGIAEGNGRRAGTSRDFCGLEIRRKVDPAVRVTCCDRVTTLLQSHFGRINYLQEN
ncbi:unnamed protein product [Scytosiphon promiscuus]